MNFNEHDLNILSLTLTGLEIVSYKLMIPLSSKFGIPFKKTILTKDIVSNYELNKTIIKKEGNFKFVSNYECIFTSRVKLSKSIFFSHDKITFSKNVCHIYGNKIEIISKFPLIASVFGIYNLGVLFLVLFQNSEIKFDDYLFPIFSLVILTIIYFWELKSFNLMKNELIEILFN